VNEKQAKLLRYFLKHTGDTKLYKLTRAAWPHMPAKARGKVSTWMKKVIVTMMAIKDARAKQEQQAKLAQMSANMEVLKGFTQ